MRTGGPSGAVAARARTTTRQAGRAAGLHRLRRRPGARHTPGGTHICCCRGCCWLKHACVKPACCAVWAVILRPQVSGQIAEALRSGYCEDGMPCDFNADCY
jgi:hypothetical protein